MQIPTVTKVVVNMECREALGRKLINGAVNDLALVTGRSRKSAERKSIAQFKCVRACQWARPSHAAR